jgi:hypothetical protein
MKSGRTIEPCALECPWHGTCMCAQLVLSAQALADRHLTLGVLCGLKQRYEPHALPPCILGDLIDWGGPKHARLEEVFA